MHRRTFLLSTLALAGCSGGGNSPTPLCPPGTFGIWPNCSAPPPSPAGWSIGPVINGRNYSPGMPATMPDNGFDFPIGAPNPDHTLIPSVHYVTRPMSLAGKTSISITFEVTGAGPYVSTELPDSIPDPYLCLHFQRAGDDWSGTGPMAAYRWYSNAQATIQPGPGSLTVPLVRSEWVSVDNLASEADFAAALANTAVAGFTFGGAGGKGHGVYATTPGNHFTLTNYQVS
jgi:hypothetical protein